MVDLRVRMGEQPGFLIWLQSNVLQHVFVDLFLQVHSHRSVGADDLVCADARVGGDASARIRDSNIARNIADRMMRVQWLQPRAGAGNPALLEPCRQFAAWRKAGISRRA